MRVVAARVSLPAARLSGRGRVLGGSGRAVYAEIGGQVVAVTARDVVEMPVGAAVAAGALPPVEPGAPAAVSPGAWQAGALTVETGGAPRWDPRLRPATPAALAARGRRLLVLIDGPSPRIDAAPLFAAVAGGDASGAAEAARALIGRGGGLTPEGDDLVGGAIAALWGAGLLDERWSGALVPADLEVRTNLVSASLLRSAARGEVVAPLAAVLDAGAPPARWRAALRTLERVGHSTGRAWVYGAAAAADAIGRRSKEEAAT